MKLTRAVRIGWSGDLMSAAIDQLPASTQASRDGLHRPPLEPTPSA